MAFREEVISTANREGLEHLARIRKVSVLREMADDEIRAALLRSFERDNALYARENALKALASLPIEIHAGKTDDYPLYGLDGHYIRIGHVRDARKALGRE